MNKWPLRFHLTMTIGGGFAGFTFATSGLFDNWGQLTAAVIGLTAAFCGGCAWAVSLGLRLAEGRNPIRELRAFYLFQIPYFMTPFFPNHLGVGVMLYLGALQNGRIIHTQLGVDSQMALQTGDKFFFAINIVPLAVLWTLRRSQTSLTSPGSPRRSPVP
jgi:hypothetical protein